MSVAKGVVRAGSAQENFFFGDADVSSPWDGGGGSSKLTSARPASPVSAQPPPWSSRPSGAAGPPSSLVRRSATSAGANFSVFGKK